MEKLRLIDIKEAILDEYNIATKRIVFTVKTSKKNKNICELRLDFSKPSIGKLDESLEGSKIWWINDKKNPLSKGQAEILTVEPEKQKLTMRFLNGVLPKKETIVNIYPLNFIEPLKDAWNNNNLANKSLKWLDKIKNDKRTIKDISLKKNLISLKHNWLRKEQREAFKLTKLNGALLWGPPGTGKTTTLGVILANYIKSYPKRKILLLSTTNLAVDQSLKSVNRELNTLDSSKKTSKETLARVGSRFIASYYKGQEYLLGGNEENIVKELIGHDLKEPDKLDIENYYLWKCQKEELQEKRSNNFRTIINKKNLVAMTTIRALYGINILEKYKFDLVIFDEASQISLLQSLIFTSLGKSCIFAGDPNQLQPICMSTNKNSKDLLENSIFKYKNSVFAEKMCFLDEQSRMKDKICNIVSQVFYNGKLKTSIENIDKTLWDKEREIKSTKLLKKEILCKVDVEEDSCWSATYKGAIRYESATRIVEICKELLENQDAETIKVLTPFRSQKNLIKSQFRKNSIKGIKVTTVHKSQGSECHTVIFDPVDGNNEFIKERKNLINVAISRSKARLIVLFSKNDLKNENLKSIYNLMNINTQVVGKPISDYYNGERLSSEVIGEIIFYAKVMGKVISIDRKNNKFKLICHKTGEEKKMCAKKVYEKWGKFC